MLLLCSTNPQSFVHDKSSSISQLIRDKSRDLQKLLRYLSGIVTSLFQDGTGYCGGWSASSSFPDRGGLSGAPPTIFVLYSNDLPSEAFSSTLSISSL